MPNPTRVKRTSLGMVAIRVTYSLTGIRVGWYEVTSSQGQVGGWAASCCPPA